MRLPLSILTDFEEFAVYDCRVRRKQGDKPAISLIQSHIETALKRHGFHFPQIVEEYVVILGRNEGAVISRIVLQLVQTGKMRHSSKPGLTTTAERRRGGITGF